MAMTSQITISAFIDRNFITADEYNGIKCFAAELPFSPDNIRRFGEIVLRHSLQDRVGALYVHRHFEMPPDSIVMKYALSEDIEIARIYQADSLERKHIAGTSFRLLEGHRFQAYEYAVNVTMPQLPQSFLNELSRFLVDNNLDAVLGLFLRAPNNDQTLCELNVAEPKISVSIPLDDVPDDVQLEATPASWVYSSSCNEPNAVSTCSEPIVRCDHSTQPENDARLLETICNAFQKRALNPEISLFTKGHIHK